VKFFEWLEMTEYSAWVREAAGWPIALTLHAFGNAIVVGLFVIICLRLLGLFRTLPYPSLSRLIPVIWVGFVIQVASGLTLWSSKPDRYLSDFLFDTKFSFVILGAVLTYFFQGILHREAPAWQAAGKVSEKGRNMVVYTTFAWFGVLIAGRLTAYLGTLYMQ
jgi:hypothetical protein